MESVEGHIWHHDRVSLNCTQSVQYFEGRVPWQKLRSQARFFSIIPKSDGIARK